MKRMFTHSLTTSVLRFLIILSLVLPDFGVVAAETQIALSATKPAENSNNFIVAHYQISAFTHSKPKIDKTAFASPFIPPIDTTVQPSQSLPEGKAS
ncbi:MAG: hypothetical protein AAB658_18120, partial [Chloroflexota bacterium]